MQVVREIINMDLANEMDCQAMMEKMSFHVAKLLDRVCTEAGLSCPGMGELKLQRTKLLEKELDVVACVSSTPCNRPPHNQDTLQRILQHLRTLEETRDFHAKLRVCQSELELDTSYSLETFAYGTTPFSTWIHIFSHPHMINCVAKIRECGNQEACTIFGSSTGSLVFFTSLLCGIPVRGVEILPYLFSIATSTQSLFCVDSVEFLCRDMLDIDISQTQLLVLTSQCWEDELLAAVVEKLRNELPHGAIVLDYKPSLQAVADLFRVVETLTAPVSWNPSQCFYLFEKLAPNLKMNCLNQK
ncbi:hypothetical protein LEN26_005992 [Aphanomyces euteiches]|nr:hypothetical protein LEN26_005992 [Aphanomyces euteiches]